MLRERNTAFRSGDRELYSSARTNLRGGIRRAKLDYKNKIEDHFHSNNSKQVWLGVRNITNHKTRPKAVSGNAALAEELNCFFARFEQTAPEAIISLPPVNSNYIFSVTEHDVRQVLRSVNPRKAAGPDDVSGRVLKDCADQLTGVFTRIFNLSLEQASVPSCLKSSIIIPVPKNTTINSLNDYRPVALTPVVMKCLEKLVRSHIIQGLSPIFDLHQFAYRESRSTEDAIACALHTTLTHLEQKDSYARHNFIDFSSAFNTIIPDRLVTKLSSLGLPYSTCL